MWSICIRKVQKWSLLLTSDNFLVHWTASSILGGAPDHLSITWEAPPTPCPINKNILKNWGYTQWCSDFTPGGAQGTTWSTGDRVQVGHVQCISALRALLYHSIPKRIILECLPLNETFPSNELEHYHFLNFIKSPWDSYRAVRDGLLVTLFYNIRPSTVSYHQCLPCVNMSIKFLARNTWSSTLRAGALGKGMSSSPSRSIL